MTETTQAQLSGNSLNMVAIDLGSTSSAAAMYGRRRGAELAMDPSQARAVRREIIALLGDSQPALAGRLGDYCHAIRRMMDELGPGDWNAARYQPPADQAGYVGQLRQILIDEDPEAMTEETLPVTREDKSTVLLDIVWSGLGRLLTSDPANTTVRNFGALRLHELARSAFTTPAFAAEGLYPVVIDLPETDVPSVLLICDSDLDQAELTSTQIVQTDDRRFVRGFKSGLIRRRPLPDGVVSSASTGLPDEAGSDLLIGQAYKDLKNRIVDYAEREFKETQTLDLAVITYPTTTPPSERARLRQIVHRQAGIEVPVMQYDEAVAAVIFTLMRDFGGNMESGIETFRAASRPVGVRSWRKNLLIIDIGGGTTDIAFTALKLTDQTSADEAREEALQAGPRTEGRVYQLEPEVIGATGHPQMGGDLLTLRVFYWIKAALADVVLSKVAGDADLDLGPSWPIAAADGEPASLAAAVMDYKKPGPAPGSVMDFLRELIPTRNKPGGTGTDQLTEAFEELWGLAEEAKRALARDEKWVLTEATLGRVTELMPEAPYAGQLAGVALDFDPDDFRTLARPVLGQSVNLAVDLMRHLLQVRPGERLDGVTLTGRAAGVPLVRELLIDGLARAFGKLDPDRELTPWNPAMIKVERHFPKAAASVGACWAEVQNQYNQPGSLIFQSRQHKAGADQLKIAVDNLILNMPCRFGLGAANRPSTLFQLGDPLTRVRWDGGRYAASTWEPATPDIQLVRYIDSDRYFEWGRYHYQLDAGHPLPSGMWFQIEIGQDLAPSLLFCRGEELRPNYVLDGTHIDLRQVLDSRFFSAGDLLRSLPDGLLVRDVSRAGGGHCWLPVFDPRQEIGADWFGDTLLSGSVLTGSGDEVRARIAARPLPLIEAAPGQDAETGARLEYTFAVHPLNDSEPGGPGVTITVPAPGRDVEGAPSRREDWAVLDAHGILHIFPGYPRYQPASSPSEAEQYPGSVYRTAMRPPYPYWEAEYAPFTGEH